MSGLKKLLYLDFSISKPYLTQKNMLVLGALTLFPVFLNQNPVLIGQMFVLYVILNISNLFAVEEKNNIDILHSILPLKRKKVVLGRFMFCIISCIGVSILSVIAGILINGLYLKGITLASIKKVAVLLIGSLMILFIQVAVMFTLGYKRGKNIYFLLMVGISVVVLTAGKIQNEKWSLPISMKRFLLLGVGVLLFVFLITYQISKRAYEKRNL